MPQLLDELCFYKAYHSNPTNVAIHMVFIPVILGTALLISNFLEFPKLLSNYVDFGVSPYNQYLNLGTVTAVGYSIFYCVLDYFGFLVAPILLGFTLGSKYLISAYSIDAQTVIYGALAAHVISWIAQFIGHGVYEKRKPALLDSLVQALVLAPYFVAFEIAFELGFRKDLEAQLNNKTAKKVSELRRKKE